MERIAIHNQTHPSSEPPIHAYYCDSFLSRLRGLMFKKSLELYEGILLVDKQDSRINSAIHMLFMRFDIAVIWINSQYIIVDIKHALPWRLSYVPSQPAQFILETRPEYSANFQIGDQLQFTK